ncbi:MAG: aldose epimerase [Micrococcaceae bacterium]|nr:aldose epimerase [Micrococcaceae bacterium]
MTEQHSLPLGTQPAGFAAPPSPGRCATGTQYVLQRGDAVAVITELAAGLRLFSLGGTVLTETYADDQIAPGATGITLAPWANRIRDGQWMLHGQKQQLDLTELSRGNASHGLLRNTGYELVEQSREHVVLQAAVFPQHGYPFLVRHRVRYELTASQELQVEQTLSNDSTAPAPFVLGAHPYLRLGDTPSEELTLTVNAATCLISDERKIPVRTEPVAGESDLRAGVPVSQLELDSAYTDLDFPDGLATHRLTAVDGRHVELWQDDKCPYVHVFVSTEFPGRTKAVALEPMTGPADAFNSGDGLRWCEPGHSFSMRWGIRASLEAA